MITLDRHPQFSMGAILDAHVTVDENHLRGRVGERELTAKTSHELQGSMVSAVYEVLHAGQATSTLRHPHHLRDRVFESLLTAQVPHRSTTASGIVVRSTLPTRPRPPDGVLVARDGVRVWVPRAKLIGSADGAVPEDGTPVDFALAAARPALSPGFLVTDASRGVTWDGPVLRLYLSLNDSSHAPDAWGTTLDRLESAGVGYRAKVLSDPLLFPRRDGIVVYLTPTSWSAVPDLVAAVAALPGLGSDTSPFTRRLGPGIAAAFEPNDPDPAHHGLSFGQHRATVLVAAAFDATAGTGERLTAACQAADIDPHAPFRNLSSPELPEWADTPTARA